MWDNHTLLRNIANTMLACGVVGLLFGIGYYFMNLPGAFPLHSVRLSAAPDNVSAEKVLNVLHAEVRGNLVTADIDHVRSALEQLPWVRGINIRREYPGQLEVQIEEHQVLARWNSNRLVNRQGEVFVAESAQSLPSFIGPEGTSTEVTQRYTEFSRQLDALELHATQLALSPRHAWQIRLNNGMVLELGREDVLQRLSRFVAAYPFSIQSEDRGQGTRGRVAYVDLRYRNGFSVKRIATDKG